MQPTTKNKGWAYIAGPMTNIPHFNFPAFDAVARRCREIDGWVVWNPHEHDQEMHPGIDSAEATKTGDVVGIAEEVGFNLHDAMIWDLPRVALAEHLVLLPGWEKSSGATAERFVGEKTGSKIWLAYPTVIPGDWILVLDDEQQRLATPALIESEPTFAEKLVTNKLRLQKSPAAAMLDARPINESSGYSVRLGSTEVRVVDPSTGGAKGSKLARFDLVPWDAMTAIAEHYGRGARKYEERNWEKGYDWSLSFAACLRHLIAFWAGEDIDPDPSLYTVDGQVVEDPSSLHIAAAAWHCLNLLAFHLRGAGTDNRPASVRENG